MAAVPAAKPTLVVAPLKRMKTKAADAATLAEMIRIRVGQSDRYTLVTPEEMGAIDDELERQLSGGCDVSSCVAEIGGALGAKYMITGKFSRLGKRYVLLLKLIELEQVKAIRTTAVQASRVEGVLDLLEPKVNELLGNQTNEPTATDGRTIEGGEITGDLGWLSVAGKPKGATIQLRGTAGFHKRLTLKGGKPWLKRVPQGLYRWRAKAKGYQSARGVIWVPTDRTKALNIGLHRPGNLHIVGKPKGAKVRVMGPGLFKATKGLPLRIARTKSGNYDVVVSRKGYRSASRVLRVRAGKTTTWRVKLKRGSDVRAPGRKLAVWSHACALKTTGDSRCWSTQSSADKTGRANAPNRPLYSVATGAHHSCGLDAEERIICWGSNHRGQRQAPKGQFASITAGKGHSCALRLDGQATCWGDDSLGQSSPPRSLFNSISAGGSHTCSLRLNGQVRCWGGDEHTESTPPPGRFTQVDAGHWHTCGLTTTNEARCWGSNRFGQARAPKGLFTSVQAGHQHSCGRQTDGKIRCWGANDYGELKAPNAAFVELSAGRFTTCGLRAKGTVTCWGALAFDEASYQTR